MSGGLQRFTVLEQTPYQGGVTTAAQLSRPLQFEGFTLANALRDDLKDLPNHNAPAFPEFVSLRQKMSVRIHVGAE